MNGNPLAGCCCCCCWPALLAVVYVLGVVFWCLICRKAGWSWALGLISLIPGIGSVLLFFIVALAQWPIERELRAAQARNVQRQA
jgi:predicted ferric reductase